MNGTIPEYDVWWRVEVETQGPDGQHVGWEYLSDHDAQEDAWDVKVALEFEDTQHAYRVRKMRGRAE